MLVTLSRPAAGRGLAVVVTAPGVVGTASWRGAGDPVLGAPVHVELEVPGVVGWSELTVEGSGAPAPAPADDELVLSGVVEHVSRDDGVVALRAAGGIVLVETAGEPPPGVVGARVTVVVRHAEVHPTGA